jgi:predicted dehydrogenase
MRVDDHPTGLSRQLRVAVAGVHGYGRWHLRNIARLAGAGSPVRLVGVCDPRPLTPDLADLVGNVAVHADLAALLAETEPDVTVVSTPLHTHVHLALAASQGGSHVLLEKPPAPTLDGYAVLVERLRTACQVGFQSLGSAAVGAARGLLQKGAIGTPRGMGVAGAWVRGRRYYSRAAWAGRRTLDGMPVVDGALTNPFAHAVATALALSGDGGAGLRETVVELYRANPIEADDTASVRLVTASGMPITVAVTLCADAVVEPFVVVHGTHGRLVLAYLSDRLSVERDGGVHSATYGRSDLLLDLVQHVVDAGHRILVPLSATRAFMDVVEAVRLAAEPAFVPSVEASRDDDVVRVIPGVAETVRRAAYDQVLLSALDARFRDARAVDC